VDIDVLPYGAAAWVKGERSALGGLHAPNGMLRVLDHRNRVVILAEDAWNIRYLQGVNPMLQFRPFSEELFVPAE